MAHPNQGNTTNQPREYPEAVFGIPGYTYHFWSRRPLTATGCDINKLKKDSLNERYFTDYARPITNLWSNIIRTYFHSRRKWPGGAAWSTPQVEDVIRVEALWSIPGTREVKERDHLVIRSKSDSEDTPQGWATAFAEAASQMNDIHPDETIFIHIAVGLKFIILIWDGPGVITGQPTLQIASDRNARWTLDSRMKLVSPGPWIDGKTGVIDTKKAYEVDNTPAIHIQGGIECRGPAAGLDMEVAEVFYTSIAGTADDIGKQDELPAEEPVVAPPIAHVPSASMAAMAAWQESVQNLFPNITSQPTPPVPQKSLENRQTPGQPFPRRLELDPHFRTARERSIMIDLFVKYWDNIMDGNGE